MDDSAGTGPGDGDNAENKPAKSDTSSGGSPEYKLPVVWSPKLGAGEEIEEDLLASGAHEAEQSEAGDGKAGSGDAAPASSRSSKFALLAASVSIAAAVGSFAATLATVGLGHTFSASAVPETTASIAETGAVAHALKSELAELTALKASLDGAARNANVQFAALAERLDRVEHAQADAPAKLAHIADTVDRLDKIAATPETTGSIASAAPAPPALPAAPTEAKITDRILQDWIVAGVHGDRAVVESRYGGEFLVAAGSMLPGLGRVDAIKRQDGQWLVITARGTIVSGH